MATADFSFRGEPRWVINWRAKRLNATIIEAERRATDDVCTAAANTARTEHIWDNRTYQTEEAVFVKRAEHQPADGTYGDNVWGAWGVEDRPREGNLEFSPSVRYKAKFEATYGDADLAAGKILSTVDVALFLEFGTNGRTSMAARPWLYPAWDAHKHEYAARLHAWYAALSGVVTPGVGRDPLTGRFVSLGKIGD